jgi:predicted nucleic acid-binding protein
MVIDASVWVAAFLAHDAHHPDATELLNKLVEDGTAVSAPLLALSEVAGALARQTGNPAVAEKAVAFLREQPWIQLAPLNDALATVAASIAAQQRLRGADAVYVALALQEDGALVTLDREMLQRAPDTVAAITPSDWRKQSH